MLSEQYRPHTWTDVVGQSPTPAAITSGQSASVPMKPFGPCCSAEPIGMMMPVDALRYASTSGHVDSCKRMRTPDPSD